jgi:type II secretory pathway pseudopilin PulG
MFYSQRLYRKQKYSKGAGFTLVEMLVYIAIVSMVGGVLTSVLISNLRAYDKSQARQNVLNNVHDSLRIITEEIKYAKSVYTPTSVFASDSGQLSLEVTFNLPAGENITYIDYYLDGGRIYEKREGLLTLPITSERVFVERLRFEQNTVSASQDSVSVEIEARINTTSVKPKDQARVTLTSAASLRGAY